MIKEFHIGLLRLTGTLRNNTPNANTSGGQDDNYSTVLTTRVYLEKDKGATSLITGQKVFNKDYTLICRYQSGIVLNPDSIWVINNETYTIRDFELIDEIKHLYIFHVVK